MVKKQELGLVAFEAQFSQLNSKGGRTLFSEVNGHFELGANHYLNGLRDAIRDFNPSFDIARAAALARGGIVLINASDASINTQEKDTSKPVYTGTKCPN